MMSVPLARTSSGLTALTVPAVPTGMNAGVRMVPRCMAIAPLRAAPSVAAMVKEKRVTCDASNRSSQAKSRDLSRAAAAVDRTGRRSLNPGQ